MRVRRTVVVVTAAAVTALVLVGCSDDESDPGTPPSGTSGTSPSSATPGSPDSSLPATGGPSDDPVVIEPGSDLLDWQPVRGPVGNDVTVSGDWTLSVSPSGRRAVLDGPRPATILAGPRSRIDDAFLAGGFALVIAQDRLETRPAKATAVELTTGRRTEFDGTSPVPTTTGGSWALGRAEGGARVLYPTIRDGDYCLAAADLAAGAVEVRWCVEPRHGFSNTRVSPGGDSILTFDDARPSCRTVVGVAGDGVEEFAGVPACKGWEGVRLEDGRAWSVVPRETRIEEAHVYATLGDGYVDLGPAVSNSLLACGDAAYFARDPQGDRPAAVLRWTTDGALDVVYEPPGGGEGFLTVPLRCGDDALTVTALTEAGDEQVTAELG